VDSDEHRRTLTPPRKTRTHPGRKAPTDPFTTPVAGVRLKPTKGRIRCRLGYGGPEGVTPRLAWHPALPSIGSPNDAS
jgi:hypothetical protein